jgi:hypothetical protein
MTTSNFNKDFLKRQANRDELETVVLKQGSTLAQVAQSFVRMQRLDEVAREIGSLDYRAVASDGIVRMVMSAVSLEDEFGLNANFAAFDENGVVTFYVDADDGKIVAGGGNVIIDAEGIFMQNSSTSWFNFEDAGGNRGTINIAADPNNDLEIVNIATAVTPGTISLFLKNTAGNVRRVFHAKRHSSIANFAEFSFERNTDMGGRVAFGADHFIDYLVSGGTGSAVVTFNEQNKDIDFNVQSATNNNFFYLDTSAETIGLDGAVTINSSMADRDFIVSTDTISKAFVVDGGLNRVEFQNSGNSAVHIISAVDGTAVYFNETGDDIDFIVRDAAQEDMIYGDAGLGRVTITGELYVGSDSVATSTQLNDAIDAVYSNLPAPQNNANDIFRVNTSGTSAFVGTIATLPGGATLTYNVSSGQENAMVPASTSQLAKLRLYNTTRGTSALISDCNAGTNTITLTATVTAGWQVGDTITIASQTVSGGTGNWVDLEITSGPTGRSALFMAVQVTDSGGSNNIVRLHPFETFGAGKVQPVVTQVANVPNAGLCLVKITGNVFTASWIASGAATITPVIREAGYYS